MESRVERNKRIRIDKRNRRIRFIIFAVCIMFFLFNLYKVDIRLREIMCITDKRIFDFRVEEELYRLHLFGNDYVVYKEQINAFINDVHSYIQQFLRMINEYMDKLKNN